MINDGKCSNEKTKPFLPFYGERAPHDTYMSMDTDKLWKTGGSEELSQPNIPEHGLRTTVLVTTEPPVQRSICFIKTDINLTELIIKCPARDGLGIFSPE